MRERASFHRLSKQLAKLRGAKVIALASESKVELLKGLGVDQVFDYGKPGWSAKVLDATRPQGVQVYLDSMGDMATEAFSLLGQFGRWIVYGARSGKQNALPADALWPMIEKNISLTGFNLGGKANSSSQRMSAAVRDLANSLLINTFNNVRRAPLAQNALFALSS